jgi:hypothetical protein
MNDKSDHLAEPSAADFFASPGGVCIYVTIGGRAFRVQFESPEGPPITSETTQPGADKAVAMASHAFAKHRVELTRLFEQVERERAERKG